MPHTPVNPSEMGAAPAAYSHGIDTGRMVFVAGQVALDSEGRLVGEGDVREQTRQVIRNIEAVLRSAGCILADVVSTTVYVPNFDGYAEYNEAYTEMFGENRPARATVQAGLVRDEWLIEMQAIAVKAR